jgi:hypothetical protein
MAYRTFAQQAQHYFLRPHDEVPQGPVGGPAAWRGAALDEGDWLVQLDDAQVRELEAAGLAVQRRGITMGEFGRDDFPLPRLAAAVRRWRDELVGGRGFVVLRGLPVERWGDALSSTIYWGLGLHLGVPGAQNADGDLLGHVADTGEDAANPFVRRYRTAGDIAFHCDGADVVGLLCLRTARNGGASRIASSVTVHDELRRRRPDLAPLLFEPMRLDRRDEAVGRGVPWVPVVPCRYAAGVLRTFWHSDYFRSVVRHPDVPPFTAAERELLDLYEAIAAEPEIRLDMQFAPGDVQLVSNHVVVHARTAYTDPPDPEKRRHLLRLWLSLD